MTPDDPILRFMLRFEGGPRDGQTSGSTFVDPDDLPPLLEIDGETYELATFSRVPPHPRIIRGALYRHRRRVTS